MASKSNRKHGGNKRSPSMVNYNAQGREEKNRKRRIAKEAKRQSACKAVRAAHPGVRIRDVSRRVRKAA